MSVYVYMSVYKRLHSYIYRIVSKYGDYGPGVYLFAVIYDPGN